MRITGGEFGGRRLKSLSGRQTRPTSDRARQALFNILGERIVDAAVLDLFAGTGAFALEAISRGADRAAMVEKDRRSVDLIRENAAALGVEDAVVVKSFDVLRRPDRLGEFQLPFDVVFIDPPYRLAEQVSPSTPVGGLLETLFREGVVRAPGGIVILEHDRRSTIAREWQHLRMHDSRIYGDTGLSFFVGREK